jgi:aminopeptidase
MKEAALNIVKNLLKIKLAEKVLIVTDYRKEKIGRIIFEAAKEVSQNVSLAIMKPTSRDGEEPPESLAKLIKEADVVIAPTLHSLTHTHAIINARKAGARIATMPGIVEFSFRKGALTANYNQVQTLCKKLLRFLKNAKIVKVVAPNGTNFMFQTGKRKWIADDGFIRKGEVGNLPAGEVFIAPIEESVNGVIVFDSFTLAKGKIRLEVKNGKVFRTSGDAKNLNKIFRNLGSKARQVAEFGIGCNPKAKLIRNTLEDEKVFGTAHVALGNNIGFGGKNKIEFHKDGIIFKPKVLADERVLIENGKWKI